MGSAGSLMSVCASVRHASRVSTLSSACRHGIIKSHHHIFLLQGGLVVMSFLPVAYLVLLLFLCYS